MELTAFMIHEKTVALVSAEGMPLSSRVGLFRTFFITLVDLSAGLVGERIDRPLGRSAESVLGHLRVSAHDRAPEVTSQIDLRFIRGRDGVVSAGDIQVEKTVIVRVEKLTSPRPARASDGQLR